MYPVEMRFKTMTQLWVFIGDEGALLRWKNEGKKKAYLICSSLVLRGSLLDYLIQRKLKIKAMKFLR